MAKTKALSPDVPLLAKIGSIVVHVDELLSADGHNFDRLELEQALQDPQVTEWIKEMSKLALVPKMRKDRNGHRKAT